MTIVMLIGLGLIFGSFVNALVWRLHHGRNWVNERSECNKCHHKLAPQDLVPIMSFVCLRGKCRYCHKKIDDSPLAEIIMPIFFVVSYLAWPLALHGEGLLQLVFWLFYLVIFMALVLNDLRWFLLPDKLVAVLLGTVVVEIGTRLVFFHEPVSMALWALSAAALMSGIFYALFQLSHEKWIGGGDVKLAVPLGLLAGTPTNVFLLLFVASMVGTLITLPMLIAGKTKRQAIIPFGPLLILGLVVVRLWGQQIIDWYMGLL